MSDILVSIIVPIYNAERYLKECIESIYNLTDDRWQLILINDGSKDKSAEICRQYQNKDKRIIYIEQKNAGVSVARNVGIKQATGEWITFLDSDDLLAAYALELLGYANTDDDMIVAQQTKRLDKFKSLKENEYISSYELQQSVFNLCEFKVKHRNIKALDDYNRWSSCSRFYRTRILKENGIEFPVGVKLGEDLLFCLRYSQVIERVLTNSSVIYYYRDNEESVTQHFHTDRIDNTIRLVELAYECVCDDEMMHYFNVFVVDRITKCCLDYYTDSRSSLSQQEATEELLKLCNRPIFHEAIDKCGYSFLATGKKNHLYNLIALWFLKRRWYHALIVCIKIIKEMLAK